MDTRTRNVETTAEWVREASGDLLRFDYDEHRWHHSLRRADGEPIGHHEVGGERSPVNGVAVHLYVPSVQKVDRRHKTYRREVAEVVRTAARAIREWADEGDELWLDVLMAVNRWRV